jgi:hypothetical protein
MFGDGDNTIIAGVGELGEVRFPVLRGGSGGGLGESEVEEWGLDSL